jgi:hypothetical protein
MTGIYPLRELDLNGTVLDDIYFGALSLATMYD